jgi:hypothetical protein
VSDVNPEPLDEGIPFEDTFLGDVTFNGQVETNPFEGMPFEKVTFEPAEPLVDESVFGDVTTSIGDGECVVCGAPTFRPPGLTKAGHRKRTPKYCDLHATNVRVSGDGPNIAGVESQLKRVQEELADDIRLLGTLAGPLFPVTGYYLFDHADPFTIAILKLAKNNNRILRVLHRAASVAPIYTVAETVAGTAYAVQVDTKGADPHNAVGRRLGVSRAYDSVYPNGSSNGETNLTNTGIVPPPRYATVQ